MTDIASVAVILRAGPATEGTLERFGFTLATLPSIGVEPELIVEADCRTRAECEGAFTEVSRPTVRWVEPSPCGTPVAALAAATAPYVTIVHPGDRLLPGTTGRAVTMLDAQPGAVLHLSRARPEPRPADPGAVGLTDIDVDDPAWAQTLVAGAAVIEGRTLARSLISCGRNLIGPPSGLVLRRSVLAPGDTNPVSGAARPGDRPDAQWLLPLILRLALRGSVVYDPTLGSVVAAPSLETVLAEHEARPELIDLARSLGFIDREDELADAILAHQDAASALIRRIAGLGQSVPAGRAAALSVRTARLWEALGSARLPIEIRVRPGPGDVGTSLRSARLVTDQVSVVAGPGMPEPPASADAALVLEAGEEVEVLDREDLVWALASPALNAASVATAHGPQVRVTGRSDARCDGEHIRSLWAARAGAVDDWLARTPVGVSKTPTPGRFAIAAPGYSSGSGGIMALHRLCDRLNVLGHDAVIVPLGSDCSVNPQWNTPVVTPPVDVRDRVVVYPEIISGNPLGAPRVVRWLLNRPGHIAGSGSMAEAPTDLLVAWNRAISEDLPILEVPLIDPRLFYPKSRPGSGALLWVGKGQYPVGVDPKGLTLITRTWPAGKAQLAGQLRGADVVYSTDWLTALVLESILCGTPVVLLGDGGPWSRADVRQMSDLRGFGWPTDDLDSLRTEATLSHPLYLKNIARCDPAVAAFADSVRDHFGTN